MKAVLHGDDFERAIAIFLAVLARELDRALVRLRAAVSEKHFIEAAEFGKQGGER